MSTQEIIQDSIHESIQNIAAIDRGTARRGALVFAAGMALAAVSFVVESAIVKAVKARN